MAFLLFQRNGASRQTATNSVWFLRAITFHNSTPFSREQSVRRWALQRRTAPANCLASPLECCMTTRRPDGPLKKPPGEGTGPTRHADFRRSPLGRVPSRGEYGLFERSVNALLLVLFVFAVLSVRAQSPDDSTFSLSPGDAIEATIDTSGRVRLRVTLTPEKCAELSAFSGRNLNKQVKIVVGGKLRSEPFIRERIAGPSLEIFVNSPEDAVEDCVLRQSQRPSREFRTSRAAL